MPIQRFYAVTVKGHVYRVDAHGPDGGPAIRKVDASAPGGLGLNVVSSDTAVLVIAPSGIVAGTRADNGSIQPVHMMGRTSELVALFMTELEAHGCLRAADRKPEDYRWGRETSDTLLAIGKAHPAFFLPADQPFGYDVERAVVRDLQKLKVGLPWTAQVKSFFGALFGRAQ